MQQETMLDTLRFVSTETNQRSLAKKLGFSMGKTNYLLKALIEKGLIRIDRFAHSKNKFNYCYSLTPEGIKQRIVLTEAFIQRKQEEYKVLSEELEGLKK